MIAVNTEFRKIAFVNKDNMYSIVRRDISLIDYRFIHPSFNLTNDYTVVAPTQLLFWDED